MSNIIEVVNQKINNNKKFSRKEILEILSIKLKSKDFYELGEIARQYGEKITKKRAYLWGAIGLDYKPCTMNCDFCSLGEKWNLVKEEREFSYEEIKDTVQSYVDEGVRWIVLRTTEFYSVDDLGVLIKKIKGDVKGTYEIGLNIGEFDLDKANQLSAIGVDFIYHSLRLGEGRDTRFKKEVRLETLSAVKNSELDLVYLAEPVGIEHTNEEIADIFLSILEFNTKVSGAMARVPVQGTPLGEFPQISDERLALIIATMRIVFGYDIPNICVHPISELAVKFGANVTVIEMGSVPRTAEGMSEGKWNNFTPTDARNIFRKYKYEVYCEEK